jgi:hypothetical protein
VRTGFISILPWTNCPSICPVDIKCEAGAHDRANIVSNLNSNSVDQGLSAGADRVARHVGYRKRSHFLHPVKIRWTPALLINWGMIAVVNIEIVSYQDDSSLMT